MFGCHVVLVVLIWPRTCQSTFTKYNGENENLSLQISNQVENLSSYKSVMVFYFVNKIHTIFVTENNTFSSAKFVWYCISLPHARITCSYIHSFLVDENHYYKQVFFFHVLFSLDVFLHASSYFLFLLNLN